MNYCFETPKGEQGGIDLSPTSVLEECGESLLALIENKLLSRGNGYEKDCYALQTKPTIFFLGNAENTLPAICGSTQGGGKWEVKGVFDCLAGKVYTNKLIFRI